MQKPPFMKTFYGNSSISDVSNCRNNFFPGKWCGNIAKSVLFFVRETMKSIRATYPIYHGMRFEVGLKCDLCCDEPCDRHELEGCTDDDCVCILSLSHLLSKRPKCTRNQLNENILSEHSKSDWALAEGKNVFLLCQRLYYSCLPCNII